MTNPYSDKYSDTVLVGTNANIKVKATDEDGKPVANVPVTLTNQYILPESGSVEYENLTLPTLTTGEDGTATFVFGLKSSRDPSTKRIIDAMNSDYKASYKLTATVAGSNVKTDTTVKFAAIHLGNEVGKTDDDKRDTIVKIANSKKTKDELVKGTNASVSKKSVQYDNSEVGNKSVDYVSSQQVSKSGVDHSVKFSSCAYLDMPSDLDDKTAEAIDETVSLKSGEYGVYSNTEQDYIIEKTNVSELQYATVNFNKMNLSQYSKVVVDAYLLDSVENAKTDKGTVKKLSEFEDGILNDVNKVTEKVYGSDNIKTEKGGQCQIDLGDKSGYLYISIRLLSPGQVNTADNQGFEVDKITGVYKKGTVQYADNLIKMDDVSITWATSDKANYEPWKELKTTDAGYAKVSNDYPVKDGYSYQYTVPSYPSVGNGYIAVYKKTAVQAYYAVSTTRDTNVNKLDATNVYKVSKNEVAAEGAFVGTISTKDGIVTVDSEKEGVTSLVGTVSTTNDQITLDASNNKLYTSVQWNPVEKATDSTSVGVAFKGQTINATAKLVDTNGNVAAIANQPITFSTKNNATLTQGDLINGGKAYVSSISNGGKTDANGSVTISFKSDDVLSILGLTAKTTSKYDVVFTLSDSVQANEVDLLWLDPTLTFGPKIAGFGNNYVNCPDSNDTLIVDKKSTWKYGVQVSASANVNKNDSNLFSQWSGVAVDIYGGVTASVDTKANKSDATITDNKDNSATVAFADKKDTTIKFVLNKDSIGSNVIVSVRDTDWNNVNNLGYRTTGYYVGTGDATINASKTINASLESSATKMSIVAANGTLNVPATENKTGYVLVTDEFNNALKDETVTLKVSGDTAFVENVGTITAKTDKDGKVNFTLLGMISGKTATVIATSEKAGTVKAEFKAVAKKNFNFVAGKYDATKNAIVLTMSEAVAAGTLDAKNFENADKKLVVDFNSATYGITGVTVSGKDITLTLDSKFKESVKVDDCLKINFTSKVTIDGIDRYVTCDATGQKYSSDATQTLAVYGDDVLVQETQITNLAAINRDALDSIGITGIDALTDADAAKLCADVDVAAKYIELTTAPAGSDQRDAVKALQTAVNEFLKKQETVGKTFASEMATNVTVDNAPVYAVSYAALTTSAQSAAKTALGTSVTDSKIKATFDANLVKNYVETKYADIATDIEITYADLNKVTVFGTAVTSDHSVNTGVVDDTSKLKIDLDVALSAANSGKESYIKVGSYDAGTNNFYCLNVKVESNGTTGHAKLTVGTATW